MLPFRVENENRSIVYIELLKLELICSFKMFKDCTLKTGSSFVCLHLLVWLLFSCLASTWIWIFIVNSFSLVLHRFGGITLLRLYFYKQNIYLGRLRTAKNVSNTRMQNCKSTWFLGSNCILFSSQINRRINKNVYENIQIMTPFLNLDQLFQISFLHIPFEMLVSVILLLVSHKS